MIASPRLIREALERTRLEAENPGRFWNQTRKSKVGIDVSETKAARLARRRIAILESLLEVHE